MIVSEPNARGGVSVLTTRREVFFAVQRLDAAPPREQFRPRIHRLAHCILRRQLPFK